MSKMPARILWKAYDGREFIIEPHKLKLNSMEEVYVHINELRKKHGYEDPTFMHVVAPPELDVGKTTDTSELPDKLRAEVENVIKEGLGRPDPKKQN